jgi:hypothetical protein
MFERLSDGCVVCRTIVRHAIFSATAYLQLIGIRGSEVGRTTMDLTAGQREVRVPTVARIGPYRFFFWAHENRETRERPHVHVVSAEREAAFWLAPVELRYNDGYTDRQINRVKRLVVVHQIELLRRWNVFFSE